MNLDYHGTRFTEDHRREVLWRTLCRHYFQRLIPSDSHVLEIGAGYAHFINNIVARKRTAIDIWPGLQKHADEGVDVLIGPADDLSSIEDNSVDFAFASNLFEHLTQQEFSGVLEGLKAKLSDKGVLSILQPNYRYAFREYFDDFTHVAIYSHVSIQDFLVVNGFEVTDLHPRFLPMTIKGRLPVSSLLIRAYLKSPIKLMGKQMLVTARKI